jgi:predicted nucleic acid-binding protein
VAYLADTNVVFRRVLPADPLHGLVKGALDALLLQGEAVFITPQNLIEFQAVATRPIEANGLGMDTAAARAEARAIEAVFPVLPDTPAVYPRWCLLVDAHGPRGRQVYDARLVAVMLVHGIMHLLTLNPHHFQRYSEIQVIDPHQLVPGA